MTIDNLKPDDASKMPEESQSSSDLTGSKLGDVRSEVKASIEQALSKRQIKLKQLSERREKGEISPFDFDLNFIFQLNQAEAPLTQQDLQHETGNQAVVIYKDDFDQLGDITIISASGEEMMIDADSLADDDVFILYPEDLA